MKFSEFARIYQVRGAQMMWFLGAGASANANVPTASDMIWEFKASLYASREKVSLTELGDLGDPRARAILQRYFDTREGYPAAGDDDEYAILFEEAHPREEDRRRYLDTRVREARPSFGHRVLAALLREGRARHVWTTNVDHCVEDAVAQLGSTADIVVADLRAPEVARAVLDEGRCRLLGKMHGDFQFKRLKNTTTELQQQDRQLRDAFIDACSHAGLVVVGYSGRDRSVMDALRTAAKDPHAFPSGLFWIHRGERPIHPSVAALVQEIRASGRDAALIEAPTFDEVMSDVLALQSGLPGPLVAQLNAFRTIRSIETPIPSSRGAFPVVRTNALRVSRWPTVARFVPCTRAPSWDELREAVQSANVITVPLGRGVLAFGADDVLRRNLAPFQPGPLEARPIDPAAARANESHLLHAAVSRALGRQLPLVSIDRRAHRLVIAKDVANDPLFAPIAQQVGALVGSLPGAGLDWAEGVELQLVHRLDRLWLLVQPITWVARGDDAAKRERTEFVNARYEKRWNKVASALLDAWVGLLLPDEGERRALGIGDGIDASFCIEQTTAFSYRETRDGVRD